MIGFEFSIMRQSVWLTLCSMGCCAMKPRIAPELDIERPLSEAANYRFGHPRATGPSQCWMAENCANRPLIMHFSTGRFLPEATAETESYSSPGQNQLCAGIQCTD